MYHSLPHNLMHLVLATKEANQATMTSEYVVHPGACFVGDELMRCALGEDSCKGMVYKSHRQLQGTEHAKKCMGEYSSHRGDHVGMCATDQEKFLCTGHASNCALPYVEHVPYCSLQHNHFPDRQYPFSLYGRCIPLDEDQRDKKMLIPLEERTRSGLDP